jgi:hypothetical protein
MLELIVLGRIPGTGVFLSPVVISIGFLLTLSVAGAYLYKKRHPRKEQQSATQTTQAA